MNEQIEVKSQLVLPGNSAMDRAAEAKEQIAQDRSAKELEQLSAIGDLDWRKIPPPMLSQLLVKIPFRGSSNEPDFYLKPWQAMIFALRCYELNLSPFSNEVWFNPKNNKVNVTLEGKMKLSRDKGFNFGPPHFTEIKRPWKNPQAQKQMIAILGPEFTEESGLKCTMSVGNDHAEYIAWLSEWIVLKSPVWVSKPMHMLQVRAMEKTISFASGSGVSELPDDNDISQAKEVNIEVSK